jgi:5-methylcytosine-specific restriction endonuclease McrA
MTRTGSPFWHDDDRDLGPHSDSSDTDGGLSGPGSLPHPHALAASLDAKVLVLNKVFLAVRVISARRAFSMLVRDLAEVIHVENGHYINYNFESWAEVSEFARKLEPEKHDWVRTVRLDIAVPRVIRLLGYDRLPAQTVKLNRRNLFARDRNQCQYCGHHFSTSDLSIDHVKPRSLGGGDTWENLVCACIRCNARKGGRTPDGASMRLIRKPIMPRRNPLIAIRLGQDRYQSWKAFLDNAYWSVELK